MSSGAYLRLVITKSTYNEFFLTNHIKTSSVSEIVNDIVTKFDVFSTEDTVRTTEETEKLGVDVLLLNIIVDTSNNVVTTGSLTSREYNTKLDIC